MKTIFVDETDKQANAKKRKFFCICGLMIEDSTIMGATNGLEAIKEKYGLTNLKDARTSGLDEATRIVITQEISACLQEHSAQVVGIVLGDFSMSFNLPNEDIYMGAMSFLMERFTIPLIQTGGCGHVVFDCVEKKLQNQLCNRFYELIRTGAVKMAWDDEPMGFYRDHISPTLHFVQDEHSVLVQAVDLIAVSLNSAIVNTNKGTKLEIKVNELPSANQFLEIYWQLFVRSSTGKIRGWGIKVWD